MDGGEALRRRHELGSEGGRCTHVAEEGGEKAAARIGPLEGLEDLVLAYGLVGEELLSFIGSPRGGTGSAVARRGA